MGKTIADELPKGNVQLVLTNVGSPNNARSAMTSPNNGPHMGFIRLQLADEAERSLSQRELADRTREFLNRHYPGVEFLQWPGGLVASVFSNGYIAPLVVEVRNDNPTELETQAKAAPVSREATRAGRERARGGATAPIPDPKRRPLGGALGHPGPCHAG